MAEVTEKQIKDYRLSLVQSWIEEGMDKDEAVALFNEMAAWAADEN